MDGEVALLDPSPYGYKIGESFIPEVFRHPVLRELIPEILALPSSSEKHGTTFVGPDSVVEFPLPEDEELVAMHCYRPELERFLAERWSITPEKARLTGFRPEDRVVETDAGPIRYRGIVLDCSGPTMALANLLDEVRNVLPVHSHWRYFDILSVDDGACRAELRASGRQVERLDPRHAHKLPLADGAEWEPSHTTVLTWVRDGVWCWQIPLFHRNVLSFGVVSRHGPVTPEEFAQIVTEATLPSYELRPRKDDSPLGRVHTRSGFARRAERAASEHFALLSDAYAFSDPVYSVGTAFAVNQAISVAERLNASPWNSEAAHEFCERSAHLQDRAAAAYQLWYDGTAINDDGTANLIQTEMLSGGLFRDSLAAQYGNVLNDSDLESAADPFHPGPGAVSIVVDRLPPIDLGSGSVTGATPCVGGLRVDVAYGDNVFAVLVAPDSGGSSYSVIEGVALSYRDDEQLLDETRELLIGGFSSSISANPDVWRSLVG
ncbi:MAG: hypothetical protein ACJAYU_000870 [Bradymonadia bacterium]